MTRAAATRVALVFIPLSAAFLAVCTGASTPLRCAPSCGCGPGGTYSYARSSRWCAQPMPAPTGKESGISAAGAAHPAR